jgi:hypothetical protein
MAEQLPVNFAIPSENTLTSYSYTDLVEGTGYIEFLGSGWADSGAVKYRLSTTAYMPSSRGYVSSVDTIDNQKREVVDSGTYTKEIDLDFDTAIFIKPKVLQGTAFFEIPVASNPYNSSEQVSWYAIVTLRKIATDGTTETDIVSVQSGEFAGKEGTGYNNRYLSFQTVVPKTNIKIGEKVRATIEIWGKKVAGSANPAVMLCFDANNNLISAIGAGSNFNLCTQAAGYTQLKISLPFKVDI